MHLTRPLAIALLIAALLPPAAFLGGASLATQSTPTPAAAEASGPSAEDLVHQAKDTEIFARFVGDFVERHSALASEKTAILARASIVAHQADRQAAKAAKAAAYVNHDTEESARELRGLRLRAVRLGEERVVLEREFGVWQVEQGVIRAEDLDLTVFSDC